MMNSVILEAKGVLINYSEMLKNAKPKQKGIKMVNNEWRKLSADIIDRSFYNIIYAGVRVLNACRKPFDFQKYFDSFDIKLADNYESRKSLHNFKVLWDFYADEKIKHVVDIFMEYINDNIDDICQFNEQTFAMWISYKVKEDDYNFDRTYNDYFKATVSEILNLLEVDIFCSNNDCEYCECCEYFNTVWHNFTCDEDCIDIIECHYPEVYQKIVNSAFNV